MYPGSPDKTRQDDLDTIVSTLFNRTVSNHSREQASQFALETNGPARPRVVLLVSAVVFLGLLLRVVALGDKSLWLDEIWSVRTAQLSWTAFAYTLVHQDPNMSAYHVLLRFWMSFGDSETVLRMLSVLCGVATIPLVYLLGRRIASPFIGICASLLFSLNAFAIQWSQEIRSYSLVVFLVSASSLLWIEALETDRKGLWVLYAVTGTLAVYAHLFACLVWAAHGLALLRSPGRACARRYALWALTSIACLSLPIVYLFYLRIRQPFIPMNWITSTGPHDLVEVFHRMAGHAEMTSHKGGRLLLFVTFALCALAVWSTWFNRQHSCTRRARSLSTFLLLWLLLPVTALLFLSLHQPILLPRYALMSLPALMILVSMGIETIQVAKGRAVVLLGLCALNAVEFADYVQSRRQANGWRVATARLLSQAQVGDGAIFCVGPGRLLFTYYARRASPHRPALTYLYPAVHEESEPANLAYLPPLSDSSLKEALRRYQRVWLVLYQDQWAAVAPVRDRIQATLAGQLTQTSSESDGDVRVLLYTRPVKRGGV